MSVTFITEAIVKGELPFLSILKTSLACGNSCSHFMQIFKVGLKTPEGKLPEGHFFAVCHLSRRYKTEAGYRRSTADHKISYRRLFSLRAAFRVWI